MSAEGPPPSAKAQAMLRRYRDAHSLTSTETARLLGALEARIASESAGTTDVNTPPAEAAKTPTPRGAVAQMSMHIASKLVLLGCTLGLAGYGVAKIAAGEAPWMHEIGAPSNRLAVSASPPRVEDAAAPSIPAYAPADERVLASGPLTLPGPHLPDLSQGSPPASGGAEPSRMHAAPPASVRAARHLGTPRGAAASSPFPLPAPSADSELASGSAADAPSVPAARPPASGPARTPPGAPNGTSPSPHPSANVPPGSRSSSETALVDEEVQLLARAYALLRGKNATEALALLENNRARFAMDSSARLSRS